MEALEALGYEVFQEEGYWVGEKRRGNLLFRIYLSPKGDVRLVKRRLLLEEAEERTLKGVSGTWARRRWEEADFFTVAPLEALPGLILAWEALDAGEAAP
ncbi:hypothetical protein [Thermus sp.]|uniref:hypothetical protein n=1 Tax=Thermus sp. TaxID=275 RepID=UPI00307EB1A6